jgi:serine/threonine-protein kinase RsbW
MPPNPMPTTTRRLEVILDTRIESVDLAEDIVKRVCESAGFAEDDVHRLGMAVREGVINAYNYGNRQDLQKKITMIVEFEPEQMLIHIVDQGSGFELEEVPDPLAEENLLRTSGRGIFMMRAFVDEFTLRRAPHGGAHVVLAKKLPGSLDNGGSPSHESSKV